MARGRYLEWSECPDCGALALYALIDAAAHDNATLDIIVECAPGDLGGCGRRLNHFLRLDEMVVIE